MRVMLITRRPLFRDGLRELLRGKDRIEVVGHAQRVEDALDQVTRLEVDAVVVDCTDPKLDPVEVATRLLKERLAIRVIAVNLESNVVTTYRGRSQVVADVDDLTDMLLEDGWEHGASSADLAALAQNRSGIYGFLAALFNQLPDDDLVNTLRGTDFEEAVRKFVDQSHGAEPIAEGGKLILRSLEAFRAMPVEEVRTALAVDRTRLVRGIKPGYGPPPPYESVYVASGKQPEVQATVAVIRAYADAGLTLSEETHDQPDFIGIELEFMRYLTRQEAEAWSRDDAGQARAVLERQLSFLREHLGRWAADFCQRMEADAELDFYKGVAILTRYLVESDQEYVASLVEAG